MTNDERDKMLMDINGNLKAVLDLSKRHDKTLYGNGQPGLCTRLTKLEAGTAAKMSLAGGLVSLMAAVGTWSAVLMKIIP